MIEILTNIAIRIYKCNLLMHEQIRADDRLLTVGTQHTSVSTYTCPANQRRLFHRCTSDRRPQTEVRKFPINGHDLFAPPLPVTHRWNRRVHTASEITWISVVA